jgi:hypothetical protein
VGFNLDACNFFGRLGVYEDHGGIVLSSEEGKNIAKALGPDNIACILQNHGLVDAALSSFYF